jgi:hypothetical protein
MLPASLPLPTRRCSSPSSAECWRRPWTICIGTAPDKPNLSRIVGALEVPAAFALLTVDGEPAALAYSTASEEYRRSRRACNFRLPMNFVHTNTVELLIAAVIVAMLARRTGLPATETRSAACEPWERGSDGLSPLIAAC